MENIFETLANITRPVNPVQEFKAIETRLNNAIKKVQDKLKWFEIMANNNHQGVKVNFNDWNKWHDLEDRLTDRLKDNYSNYKAWHWNEYQFNAYP